jgi:hypothetical protein
MKLSLLFESLLGEEFLEEASVADTKAKYYSDMPDDVFKDIVSIDPNSVIKDGEVVKMGPYSKILLSMYMKGNLKKEDSAKATEYLEIAYANKLQLSNNLKSIGDLYELVKPYMKLSVDDTDVNKLIQYLDDSQYDMELDGEKWYIFKPKDEKSACVLGAGTEWCTTWGPESTNPKHKDRSNRFDYHDKQGSMYIIINKEDNSDKYQFHIPSRQFMDKGDRQVDLNRFFKKKEEVFLYFNPEFKDLDAYSSDKLMEFVVKPLIDNDHKDILIEKIVELNSDNEIIKLFKDSVAEAYDDFDSLNEILSNDFQIEEHYYGGYLKFEELKDSDLETYDSIGGYYGRSNNIYVEEDDVNYYIENSWDEIIKEVKNDFISYFKSEGHDIMGYLASNDIKFDGNFLQSLLDGSDKLSDFNSDVHQIVYEAEDDAETQSEDEIKNKVDGVFDMSANEINTNVFLLFLLKSEVYDMESFKEFLSNTFDIIVDSGEIWETINELKQNYVNVDVKEIVRSFSNKFEDMCEWYLGTEDDDIRRYELKINPDSSEYYNNTPDEHVSHAVLKLIDKIEAIVYKHTKKYDLMMNDDNRNLQIFTRKINPSNQTVGVRFFNNITKKNFEGYVKIDDLPRYINFNNAPNFFKRLKEIFRGLKLSSNRDNFENELVKLKLDYNNVDVDNGLIYCELTNKSNNHTDKGMINIESIPTYYTNTKLFEELNRFKKLL